jgi:hypothetical protein
MHARDHRRRLGASLAAGFLVAGLALTGCSASNGGGSSAAANGGAQRAPGAAAGAPAAGAQGAAGAAGGAGSQAQTSKTGSAPSPASPNAAAAGRSVIYSGEIQLRSAHVDAAVQQAQTLVQSVGGYIDSEQVGNAGTMPWYGGAPATGDQQQPSDGSSPVAAAPSLPLAAPSDAAGEGAVLVLRVPTASYDTVFEQLSGLGTVLARERASQDVTEQVVDLDARVATEKTSIDRLKALMGQAGSLNDILTLEQAISQRESDLNSLESQVASLRGQVAMSTVTLELFQTATPPPPPAKPAPQGAWGAAGHALSSGWHALYLVGRGLLVAASAMLPFLAVLALLAYGVYRFARPRRKEKDVEHSADE